MRFVMEIKKSVNPLTRVMSKQDLFLFIAKSQNLNNGGRILNQIHVYMYKSCLKVWMHLQYVAICRFNGNTNLLL